MTNIEIQGLSTPENIKVSMTPEFSKNRAMQERAMRMMSDESLPQVARDVAKSDLLHYSMENIRAADSVTSKNTGETTTGEHLLLEPDSEDINHKQRVANIEGELRRHYDGDDAFTLDEKALAEAHSDRDFSLQKIDEVTKTPEEIRKILRDVENSHANSNDVVSAK